MYCLSLGPLSLFCDPVLLLPDMVAKSTTVQAMQLLLGSDVGLDGIIDL